MISGSSVLSALAFYTVMLFVICLLRRWTFFLQKGGAVVLLLTAVFATARLLFPLEIPFSHTVRSWNLLGALLTFFITHPITTRLLLAGWAIGAVYFLQRDARDLYRAHKWFRRYDKVESESVQRIAERLSITCPVVVSSDIDIPFVAGIFHHTIYFPTRASTFPEIRIELALAHEAQHIRSHDALIKLFFGVLSAVMWWNPVGWLFRGEIDNLLEMRCDRKVTAHLNAYERCEYVEMLQEMAKLVTSPRQIPALALDESLATGKEHILIQRGKVILGDHDRPSQPAGLAALCILTVLFCASYLVIFQPAGAPTPERFEEEADTYYYNDYADLESDEEIYNAFIVKGSDGRYQLCINYKFIRYLSEEEIALDKYKNLLIVEENRNR